MAIILETPRLYLRTWQATDAESYWTINQDPQVIKFLGDPLTLEAVKQFMATANQRQEACGFTLWAAELKKTRELIGFIGLNNTDFESHFTPAIEVGWRLGSQYWGHGYATEGAKAALAFAFNALKLDEIVSFTVPMNQRSIQVMERIGLQRDFDGDFRHPKLALDHKLSFHVLYRLNRDNYLRIIS